MRPLIHDRLVGKTIQTVLTNGRELILQCTTGEEVVIGWGIDGPIFLRQDVRIMLPTATAAGVGDRLMMPNSEQVVPLDELFRGH